MYEKIHILGLKIVENYGMENYELLHFSDCI